MAQEPRRQLTKSSQTQIRRAITCRNIAEIVVLTRSPAVEDLPLPMTFHEPTWSKRPPSLPPKQSRNNSRKHTRPNKEIQPTEHHRPQTRNKQPPRDGSQHVSQNLRSLSFPSFLTLPLIIFDSALRLGQNPRHNR